MLVVLRKRVWQVVLLLAVALGGCQDRQAHDYYKLAWSYRKNKDYAKALQYLQKAAEMGDAWAYYTLGGTYKYGDGVEKDYAKALQYLQKAAEMGVSDAYNELGDMYRDGDGVEKDYAKALQYYQKATEWWDPKGYYNLGVMYEKGEGVAKDYSKALQYYKSAAERTLGMSSSMGIGSFEDKYGNCRLLWCDIDVR
ncbi:hypothetical protein HHE02_16510 [Helicobacter heilmannii]|uniref:tetratricopeptide repeat protein n=1 Tax=Helicobacter heilmannii TaxID=35817 RepID=UPI0006A235B8|nr:tetratricopeptide repeat protein [Helicobacter heilmannii]CRF48326.1 hypothetical protein HHE02_16510 [Helicobacter heilmannii]